MYLPANFIISFLFQQAKFYCESVPHLHYPFTRWLTSQPIPLSRYYKQTWILVARYKVLWLFSQEWNGWSPDSPVSGHLKNLHTDFHCSNTTLSFHQQWIIVSLFPLPQQDSLSTDFLMIAIMAKVKWHLKVVWNCISLIPNDAEHILNCLSPILTSFVNSLFRSVVLVWVGHLFSWFFGLVFSF